MSYSYKRCNSKKNNLQSPVMSSTWNFMPVPTGASWNVHDMPWSSNIPNTRVMEFHSEHSWDQCDLVDSRFTPCKRKADIEPAIPAKQHISEEKMAAHFNNLHISLDYPADSVQYDNYDVDVVSNNNDPVNIKSYFESKLKSAQKIVLCEEMRQLKNDPIVPLSLLNNIEKPCKAIVLWQPPPTLETHIQRINNSEQNVEEEQDNNNCSNVDLNNMDMDIEMDA